MTGYASVRHGADIRAYDCLQDVHEQLTLFLQICMRYYCIRVKELYEESSDDEYPQTKKSMKL